MTATVETNWQTDPELLARLPGGPALIEWFGFVPSFHDAVVERLEIADHSATLALKAHRMTNEVDADGYFVLDRHVVVTLHFAEVSVIALNGNAAAIIFELRIRRLGADGKGWPTCPGPDAGDIEVSFESSYGLEGRITAKRLAFELII
jgi:hypothetical protein